jgi:predicted TPR repeat methyltransferase
VGQWRVLDVGCGSGLIGRLFTHLVGLPPQSTEALLSPAPAQSTTESEGQLQSLLLQAPTSLASCAAGPCMVGVDISEKMAHLALVNGGYSVTLCDDLDKILRRFDGVLESEEGIDSRVPCLDKLDMLVAADTFLYVGPLEEVGNCLACT